IFLCCFIVFVVFYMLFKQAIGYNKDFIQESKNSKDFKIEQLRVYLFFLGLLAPLSELLFEFFSIREKSELLPNLLVGFLALTAYLLSKKANWLRKNLYPVIVFFLIAFTLHNWYKVLFFPFELITIAEFYLFLFLAHIILLNIKH